MTGPPTPPATTPAELQDEARLAAVQAPQIVEEPSDQAVATGAAQPIPDSYQTAFPVIIEATSRKDYKQLVTVAENTDYSTPNDSHPSRLLIVAPLVLGHLVLDNPTLARYSLIRLPKHLASLPLSHALMALVVVTMNRQHVAVYEQADALKILVAQPDFIDKDLGSIIGELLVVFIDHFRQRTLGLLSKAYTSLSLSLACTYLALAPDTVIQAAQQHGWSYDNATQIFSPSNSRIEAEEKTSIVSSLSTFHFVADSVAKLEG